MRLHLGSIVLDGTGAPYVKYTLAEVTGIFGGVGVKGESVDRPHAHGEFDLPVYRTGRMISAGGLILSKGLFGQEQDINALAAVAADGGAIKATFESELGSRSFAARLQEGADVEVLVPGEVARYQVRLQARDPRLYGEQRAFTGASVEVHQLGNFPAAPAVEVVGPRSGPYTITGPGGRKVTVSQPLSAGQTHRIDFATGGVTRNGSRQLGALTHFTPWSVPPGTLVPMSISAGSMTVIVADTYM